MKKSFGFVFLILLLGILSGCQRTGQARRISDPTTRTNATQPAISTATVKITKEEAVEIALKNAGFTKDQIRDLEAELDKEDGSFHYDVEFEHNDKDYEYKIHAETGKILKAEKPF